ncbi:MULTISPECIES: hypothetical protein [Bizionia]|uniref:Uncharacterized protein n=1 Tax=Bizionia algoritergicola TaxID=291187 RepID=A0A5D0R076_9FLAO|nr:MULTISPECIES: hypothetical protein [Bizionia]OBX23571.1 hypothetical protein BAA08_04260 [Bizionia sp. APA-3]TYB74897.1 hypothetical protein ES675_01805 [Bizionia algoritergicola]
MKTISINIVSNQVLNDNLEATDIEDYTISEIFIRDQIEFEFLFMDTEDNCFNQAGFKLIRNINNTSQLMYEDFELGDYGSFYDCNNYQNQSEIPMYLPSDNLILIKQ